MAVGDLINPIPGMAGGSDAKMVNATPDAQGYTEFARNVQGVAGGTAIPISGSVTIPTIGAANYANGQVTAAVASGVLVAARATRRSVTVRNQDTVNSAYIGAGTVTSGNGLLLKAGESISIDTTAAINCIRATSDVALGYMETYNS